jgi:hypothetical protein
MGCPIVEGGPCESTAPPLADVDRTQREMHRRGFPAPPETAEIAPRGSARPRPHPSRSELAEGLVGIPTPLNRVIRVCSELPQRGAGVISVNVRRQAPPSSRLEACRRRSREILRGPAEGSEAPHPPLGYSHRDPPREWWSPIRALSGRGRMGVASRCEGVYAPSAAPAYPQARVRVHCGLAAGIDASQLGLQSAFLRAASRR